MGPLRDRHSIRPSLWLVAAVVVGAAGIAAMWFVADLRGRSRASSGTGQEVAEVDGRPRPSGRRERVLRPVEDPSGRVVDRGPVGSVRDAWAEASRFRDSLPPGERWPPVVEALVDPQMHTCRRSFADPSTAPFAPVAYRGTLTQARGLDLPAGTNCEVRLLPVRDATFNCLIRVTCGGVVVYPDRAQTAGYVTCELEGRSPVYALDALPTGRDGDPAVTFDARTRRVVVEDIEHPAGSTFEVAIHLDPGTLRVM